jgi:hypothetical protein
LPFDQVSGSRGIVGGIRKYLLIKKKNFEFFATLSGLTGKIQKTAY